MFQALGKTVDPERLKLCIPMLCDYKSIVMVFVSSQLAVLHTFRAYLVPFKYQVVSWPYEIPLRKD